MVILLWTLEMKKIKHQDPWHLMESIVTVMEEREEALEIEDPYQIEENAHLLISPPHLAPRHL
jgi:hypothetical protein